MLKVNTDHRGLFVELYKESESKRFASVYKEPKQISYLTINKGCFRGNHYHNETIESFILLEGDCEIVLSWSRESDENDETCFDEQQRTLKLYDKFDIPLGFQHTLFSAQGAKLLILSSKEFDPANPDVFNLCKKKP